MYQKRTDLIVNGSKCCAADRESVLTYLSILASSFLLQLERFRSLKLLVSVGENSNVIGESLLCKPLINSIALIMQRLPQI